MIKIKGVRILLHFYSNRLIIMVLVLKTRERERGREREGERERERERETVRYDEIRPVEALH